MRAPHADAGGTGTNAFQGEDLDVLADAVYSRRDEGNPRTICRPAIDALKAQVARESGDRTAIWRERAYDLTKIKAATLIAHGGNDFNVMTEQAAQLNAVLKAQNTPRLFYFHQDGHGGDPPDFLTNLWFTKYLWGVDNGVETLPRSWVVREPAFCPPRSTTVVGSHSNTATLTVASSAPFRVGLTLNVGSSATTRVIRNIPDATHVTLTTAVSVANGTALEARCGPPNPTPYADWPDPAAADAVLKLSGGSGLRGGLTLGAGSGAPVTFTDNSRVGDTTLLNATSSANRLLYVTEPLPENVRISGSPRVSLRAAFSKPKANLSVALVSLPESTGPSTFLTRGWMDPENRTSDAVTEAVTPGTFYTLTFALQPKDAIVAAGRRLGLMVFSSDRQYTIRPEPGTQVTLDPAASTLTLPVIGNLPSPPQDPPTNPAPGPESLTLTLGAPATFGTFTPGHARQYEASMSAVVTGGTLAVAAARLTNGASTLPQPLQVSLASGTAIFRQAIGATDVLRTGVYSARVTFTAAATTP